VRGFIRNRAPEKAKGTKITGQPDILVAPVSNPRGNKEEMVSWNIEVDAVLQFVVGASSKKHQYLPKIMGMPCNPAGQKIRGCCDISQLGKAQFRAGQFGFPDFKNLAFS
jgi:hypothetical protein